MATLTHLPISCSEAGWLPWNHAIFEDSPNVLAISVQWALTQCLPQRRCWVKVKISQWHECTWNGVDLSSTPKLEWFLKLTPLPHCYWLLCFYSIYNSLGLPNFRDVDASGMREIFTWWFSVRSQPQLTSGGLRAVLTASGTFAFLLLPAGSRP